MTLTVDVKLLNLAKKNLKTLLAFDIFNCYFNKKNTYMKKKQHFDFSKYNHDLYMTAQIIKFDYNSLYLLYLDKVTLT